MSAAWNEPPISPAEPERHGEADQHPQQERAVDEPDQRVLQQVGRVTGLEGALVVHEEPAEMRVREPLQRASQAAAVVHVRAVRVAGLVRERVVLAVVGDPRDHRPLDRRGTEDRERGPDRPLRLEGAVCQVAVKADRDPQPSERVDDREDDQVTRMKRLLPQLPPDDAERHDRAAP